jgi:hypothetical protein
MGIWNWVGLPLVVVLSLGSLVESFRLPVRRPRRADFLPFVIPLFWVGEVFGGDSRPLMERMLKGSAAALFTVGALVIVVRWALMRAGERASTSSAPGEGQSSADVH